MAKVLFIPPVVGFVTTLLFAPLWIKKAKKIGLTWEDMHKPGHPKNVAGSGGIAVLMGFCVGVLLYIALKTFVLHTDLVTIKIFALLTTILIAGMIGFIDDLFWRVSGGLSARLRIFLLVFASIPLVVINAGSSSMLEIELGLLYPLIIIPVGVVGATATFNFIAGYNGLEAGQGILLLSALAVATFLDGSSWLSLICLVMIAPLLGFYIFNKVPARVFPGDVMTYSIGALIAGVAILGDIEKIAIFFFIPYILEVGLKIRGGLKKQSFAQLNESGGLEVPYEKFYGIEHIGVFLLKKIKKSAVREKDLVYLIYGFQALVILAGFALFGNGLGM